MEKTKQVILLILLFSFIIISIFLFSCKNPSVEKVSSVEPINLKTDVKIPVAIIDTKPQKEDTTNAVISNDSKAQMSTSSDSKGIIFNQSNVKNAANVATGKGSTANMGTVVFTKGAIINKSDIKNAANVAPGKSTTANMGSVSVKTTQTNSSVKIDVSPDTAANTQTGADMSHPKNATTKAVETEPYKEYKVELGADEKISMSGIPGQLRVWIGIPEYQPNFSPGMIHATGSLPAVGTTAKVKPVAPAFKVEPKESACMKIHPTGSEVGFSLIPIEEGTFEVGADVKLYNSDDCSGIPIPKATTYLKVQVFVDHAKEMKKHTKEFKEIFWDKLLEFWGGILAVFFALLLFLLRRHLKKWFGFEDKK